MMHHFLCLAVALLFLSGSSVVPQAAAELITRSSGAATGRSSLSSLLVSRALKIGDFDAMNRMMAGLEFEVPLDPANPLVIEESGMTMTLTSMTCHNFWMGDVDLQWSGSSQNEINLETYANQKYIAANLQVIDLDVACFGTFDFDFFLGSGQGAVQIDTVDSDAMIGLFLAIDEGDVPTGTNNATTTTSGRTLGTTPPTVLEISSCQGAINVNDVTIDLDGFDIIQGLINVIDLENMLQGTMGEFLCDFLQDDLFADDDDATAAEEDEGMLKTLAALLEPYLDTTTTNTRAPYDPVAAEKALRLPDNLQAMNFRYPTSQLSIMVKKLLDEFSTSSSSSSLHQMLGESLLNKDGEFRLDIRSLLGAAGSSGLVPPLQGGGEPGDVTGSAAADAVIQELLDNNGVMEMVTQFGNFSLELDYFAISGLEPYLRPPPSVMEQQQVQQKQKQLLTIETVGNYSIQVQMAVEDIQLRTAVNVKLVTPPNNKDASATTAESTMDSTIILEIPIRQMDMRATLLAVIDEAGILGLKVGDLAKSMSSSENDASSSSSILDCVLAKALYKGELMALEMSPKPMALGRPNMAGNLGDFSPGLERVGATLLDMLYAGFGPSLTRAIPNMLETKLVYSLNDLLENAKSSLTSSSGSNSACSTSTYTELGANGNGGDRWIDFRELLASPVESPILVKTNGDIVEQQGMQDSGSSELGGIAQNIVPMLRSTIGGGLVGDSQMDSNGNLLSSLFGGGFGGGGSNDMLGGLFESFGLPGTVANGGESSGSGKSIVKEEALVSVNAKIPMGNSDARVQLEIANLRIDNIDSMGDMSLFNPMPTHGQMLNNSMMFGVPPQPVRISASVVFGMTSGGEVIRNEMTIALNLMSSHLIAQIMLLISENKVMELTLEDILDFDCLVPTLLGAPVLNEFGVRVPDTDTPLSFQNVDFIMGSSEGGSTLNLTCTRCESPDFVQMSQLLQQPEEQAAAGQSIESLINHLLATAVNGNNSYAQSRIDRFLVDAAHQCGLTDQQVATEYQSFESATTDGETSSVDYILTMLVVLLSVLFVTLVISVFVRWVVTRRHRKWLRTLSGTHLIHVYQAQKRRKEEESAKSSLSKSMFLSQEVSLVGKVLIPIVILGNIALFLSGHLSVGGSVRVYVQLAGEELVLDDVYVFSIAQTCLNLWNAGGRALSTLMFLFSMFWPYAKQAMTLVVWFLPPRFLSMQRRGTILHWLDRLAKWSMVDVFVMIVALTCFRITMASPSQPFLPEDLWRADLMVAPLWGLYANMTAQLVSQVSSHFILRYQRKIEASADAQYSESIEHNVDQDAKQRDDEAGQLDEVDLDPAVEEVPASPSRISPQHRSTVSTMRSGSAEEETSVGDNVALCRQVFYRAHRDETDGLVVRRGVNGLVIFGALAIATLIVVGCTVPSFATETQGVVGMLVNLGREEDSSTSYYSIFTVSKLLLGQSEFLGETKDFIGLLAIVLLFIMTTLAVPLALTVAQLFRWMYPLSQNSSGRLDIWIEILEAWQYIEVYVVTVLLAVWQLADISEFMINEYCGEFNRFFSEMMYFNVLTQDEAQCFRMQPTIQAGTYILLSATVLLAVLRTLITLAVRQVEYQSSLLSSSIARMDLKDVEVLADEQKETDRMVNAIAPFPVLLTDRFRWLLVKA